MFCVATRPRRHAGYTLYQEYGAFPAARVAQLDLVKKYYDAAVFRDTPFDRHSLVYTHPKAKLENPYDRLTRLFSRLVDEGSYRVMASYPSPGNGFPWFRLYLFSYWHRFMNVRSRVHAVDLRPNANIVRVYEYKYCWEDSPPVTFAQQDLPDEPLSSAARMRGVYIADVTYDYNLYFGYVESPSDEQVTLMQQVQVDAANLYAR